MGGRMREELLAFVSKRGTLLEPAAVEYLLSQQDPIDPLNRFLASCPEVPFVVTLQDVVKATELGRNAALRTRPTVSAIPPVTATVAVEVPALPPAASFRRAG